MSLLEQVFSLSKEEQLALLDELEKKATTSSPIVLPKEVIDTFELPPEVNIEEELAKIKEIVLAEVQSITINAPKGDKGEKGPKGDKGDVGPQGKDGKDGKQGKDGKDGVDGKDGISVTDAHVDFDGSLVITLSNGKEINAGDVVPNDKKDLVIQSLKNGALTLLELGIVEYLASPPPIGSTTPNTGKFTSVTTPSVTATTSDLSLNVTGSGAIKHNLSNSVTWYMASPASSVARLMAGGQSVLEARISVPNWMRFQTNSSADFLQEGYEQFRVANTTSAVNYINVTGSTTGNQTVISALGSDANIPLALSAKGSGTINLYQTTAIGRGSTNWMSVNGSTASGYAVQTNIFGADTNVSMAFQPKGTGAIDLAAGSSGVNISNGGTVTAIARTNTGTGYSSAPTVTIAPPTTAGGVQATAQASGYGSTAGVVVSGGTGYTLNDTITVNAGGSGGIYTVTGVTGGVVTSVTTTGNGGTYPTIPTNPVATTGGTGTGLTLNLSNFYIVNFAILTAGSGYIEQPAVTITGGGGSSAAAYVTVGSGTKVTSLGNSTDVYVDTTPILHLRGKNTSNGYPTNTTAAFGMIPPQSNFGAPILGTSSAPYFVWAGTGTSQFMSAATNPQTSGNTGSTQYAIAHTSSAVNYLQSTGGATGNPPVISAQGSDTNISPEFRSKGTGSLVFSNSSGQWGFYVTPVTSTANQLRVSSSVAGSAPSLAATGSDTNINLNLVPKGTGVVQQNGTALALSTHKYHAFNVGTYYYDTYEQTNFLRLFTQNATADTIRYGAVTSPEYYDYGTSTWTAWAAGQSGIQALLDGNPATGMDVAHANRTFRFIVNASDGWPTNALVMLQTTWSAVTYTTATVTIASSSTVGGTYTTRQVMTFSSANTGNNWGMHAYYTNAIHTGDTFYRITIDLTDWVDNTTYTTYPLRNLCIFSNYSAVPGRQNPFSTSFDKRTTFIGGISTVDDVNGSLYVGRYNSSDPSTYIDAGSSATRMNLRTQYTTQLQLFHTVSAVNYLQVSGGSTGNGVTLAAVGSDTNINTFITSKNASSIVMQTNGRENFRVADGGTSVVNNLQAVGSTTGFGAILQARGSDTNVDITFTPKGTGVVQFGTHTATADVAITGYITIKDSSGTLRKLAVIT